MSTSAERVRRFRERQRAAHPKEPNWQDLEGRLKVVSLWLSQGNQAPNSFKEAIRTVALCLNRDMHDFTAMGGRMFGAWLRENGIVNAAIRQVMGGSFLSEEEYRLIRGLLHPDKHFGEDHERYNRAFELFSRLKDVVVKPEPLVTDV